MRDLNLKFCVYEVGYNIPAKPGMSEEDIQTPCLVLDLDALERNIKKMGDYAAAQAMRHRVHGKMHKSVAVATLQEALGGVFVAAADSSDILNFKNNSEPTYHKINTAIQLSTMTSPGVRKQ